MTAWELSLIIQTSCYQRGNKVVHQKSGAWVISSCQLQGTIANSSLIAAVIFWRQ